MSRILPETTVASHQAGKKPKNKRGVQKGTVPDITI
jgi:hypothetical protein